METLEFHPGARPSGVANAPDGTKAYLALQGSGALVKLDVAARSVESTLELGGSPRAIAITADGSRVFVARFLSPIDHAEVSVVDGESFELVRTEELAHDETPDSEANGRGVYNYLRALSVSPDGTRVFVAGKKDNTQRGAWNDGQNLTFENTVRAATAQLLVEGGEDLSRRTDLNDRALPSAVVPSPLGDLVFVATELSNSVEVVDAYSGVSVTSIQQLGQAPDGLAMDAAGKRLFVHSFLSRSLEIFDVSGVIDNASNGFSKTASVSTTDGEVLASDVLAGKILFYDALDDRMSRDNYIACAGCHLDGEHDGRIWDFSDRGEGLRNTITLAGKKGLGQGPLHWSANFDEVQDFENDMRNAFGGLGFLSDTDFAATEDTLGEAKAGRSAELDALAAYVSSLETVPASPHRKANGAFTDRALAGKKHFERLKCAECHSGPALTNSDGTLYDVGTITSASGYRLWDVLTGIDTPTLVGLWDTAPYLHDGSAATLRDVLDRAAAGSLHGEVASLSEGQRDELAQYLLELDDRPVVEEPAAEESGCGCRVGPRSTTPWGLLGLLAFFVLGRGRLFRRSAL
jgi:MYXO-CTERM domain-containing protein